jgi:hypothetical protein
MDGVTYHACMDGVTYHAWMDGVDGYAWYVTCTGTLPGGTLQQHLPTSATACIPRPQALAKAAENAVKAEYDALEAAVLDPSKRGPGTPYTQPWLNSKA